MNYREAIAAYIPINEQEVEEKRVILDYIEKFPDNILLRENEFAHMTSSGFIMNKTLDKVLLIYHKIYDTWAWTGGHADGDEDLLQIALKEATEETGVKNLVPLTEQIATIDILPVWGHMKKGKFVATHLHLNAAYVLIADEKETLIVNKEETNGVKWIDVDKMPEYCNEKQILPIYNKLVNYARSIS